MLIGGIRSNDIRGDADGKFSMSVLGITNQGVRLRTNVVCLWWSANATCLYSGASCTEYQISAAFSLIFKVAVPGHGDVKPFAQ